MIYNNMQQLVEYETQVVESVMKNLHLDNEGTENIFACTYIEFPAFVTLKLSIDRDKILVEHEWAKVQRIEHEK